MKVVSFKIDEDLLDLIEREARREGITKSELIRKALKKYLYGGDGKARVVVTRKMKIYL